MPNTILICTAWPYANGSLHVGHLAGVYVPGDVFARFQRLRGNNVLMVSGSDAHGTPITVRADQEGITPREVVERYHNEFLGYWRDLGISFDLYTHTMTDNHREVVQAEFLDLRAKEYLFTESVEALYDEQAGRYLPDRYVEGTCPHCGYLRARGDQCENCGRLLDANQLIDPKSRFSGSTPVVRTTEHFFLDLPKLNERLIEWVRPMDHWRPNVYKFTMNFLEGGLQARAITRDLEWGVPIPLEGYDDKRIYVWFEACTGYLSASIEWAKLRGDPDAWKPWWEDASTRQYYFIGKDNIPFHTVIWPAILMARGDTILPYDVPANEYMNFGGQKASKSAGIGTTVPDMLASFQPDAIRYYLIANGPESADTNFAVDDFVRRINDELVAAWGNLVHRTLSFAQRYFNGQVPDAEPEGDLLPLIDGAFERVAASLDAVKLKEALREAMSVAQAGNRYFDERAPWVQVKQDPAAAAVTMATLLNALDGLKVLFAPFVPFSSEKLHALLGWEDALADQGWQRRRLPFGQALPKPAPLFVKLEVPAEE